jgi:hypothetical protein
MEILYNAGMSNQTGTAAGQPQTTQLNIGIADGQRVTIAVVQRMGPTSVPVGIEGTSVTEGVPDLPPQSNYAGHGQVTITRDVQHGQAAQFVHIGATAANNFNISAVDGTGAAVPVMNGQTQVFSYSAPAAPVYRLLVTLQ